MASHVKQKDGVDLPLKNEPEGEVQKSGRWECICIKSLSESNKFWVVLVVTGVVGLGVAAVGTTGFFAQMNMLPASLAKLNVLGAMGNFAIAAIVVGGALFLLGIAATIMLVKRYCDKKKEEKRKEEELEFKRIEEEKRTAELHKAEALKKELERARKESITLVPEPLRVQAAKMNVGERLVFQQGDDKLIFIGCAKHSYVVEQGVPKKEYKTREARFAEVLQTMNSK